MLRKLLSLCLWILVFPGLVLSDTVHVGGNTTVQTDGSQTDGAVSLLTQNPGPIRFYTNNVLRGYVDGTTGVLTGFTIALGSTGTFTNLTGTANPSTIFRNSGTGRLSLNGGTTESQTNGAVIQLYGASSSSGLAYLGSSTQAASEVQLDTGSSSGVIRFSRQGVASTLWYFNASDGTFRQGSVGGGIIFDAAIGVIQTNTSDSADSKKVIIAGGGSASGTRGAYIDLAGNEVASTGGAMDLVTGNAATGKMRLFVAGSAAIEAYTNSLLRWSVDSAGNLAQDGTNGGDISFNKASNILANTGTLRIGTASSSFILRSGGSDRLFVDPSTGAFQQNLAAGGNWIMGRTNTYLKQAGASIAAAGANQAAATGIARAYNYVSSGTGGVRLENSWDTAASASGEIKIHNATGVAINVYPPSGGTIIGSGGADTAVSVANNTMTICYQVSNTLYACGEMPAA